MSCYAYTTEVLQKPLFTSRSSELFPWRGNTLLKLFRSNVSADLILNEEINTTEAYHQGMTNVICYGHITVGDRLGLIIQRLEGDTLLHLGLGDDEKLDRATDVMTDLQLELHKTHTQKLRSYKEMFLTALQSQNLAFLTKEEKEQAIAWMNQLPDGDTILHLDYHLDNLMSDGNTTTIIDWMTAARGIPAADVSTTKFLFNEAEMIPGLPEDVVIYLTNLKKKQYKRYIARYRAATGITDEEIDVWMLAVYVIRLGVWGVESERSMLQAKIKEELKKYQ